MVAATSDGNEMSAISSGALQVLLREYWGIEHFRPLQLEAVEAVLQVTPPSCSNCSLDIVQFIEISKMY